jgi:hypothetical protein
MNSQQLLVVKLLENADRLEWSAQGLGMLRTYLSKEVRLHIWHSSLRVPNVSKIHNHPWDFRSEVVVGEIVNRVYRPGGASPTHTMGTIRCGVGGGLVRAEHSGTSSELPVRLVLTENSTYPAGTSYSERADELHETEASDGTVTIVTRSFKADTEHATVCYPLGTSWVSAEPRPATRDEVQKVLAVALARLRGGHAT